MNVGDLISVKFKGGICQVLESKHTSGELERTIAVVGDGLAAASDSSDSRHASASMPGRVFHGRVVVSEPCRRRDETKRQRQPCPKGEHRTQPGAAHFGRPASAGCHGQSNSPVNMEGGCRGRGPPAAAAGSGKARRCLGGGISRSNPPSLMQKLSKGTCGGWMDGCICKCTRQPRERRPVADGTGSSRSSPSCPERGGWSVVTGLI